MNGRVFRQCCGPSVIRRGVRKALALSLALGMGVALAPALGLARGSQASSSTSQAIRPIGAVTEIKPGSLTLHTDSGPSLLVRLPENVLVVRVPPGAKTLKAATKITVGDIHVGDRVIARGRFSDDQKSLDATSLIVMSETALARAHEAEEREWREHGIGGVVKAIDPASKEITISVPNFPPTPGNLTHPVVISVAANTVLLRYAPDSVKFSDAKPAPFDEIRVGDQVRALGTKSADGSQFAAEKLVSGTFRNIGATVISVDAPAGSITVKDLATGQPVLVKTNADSKLHTLPPFIAMMIARFNLGGAAEGEGPGGPGGNARGKAGGEGARPGASDARQNGPGGMRGGGPPGDFDQMLNRTPKLSLSELKPGEPLIVVSTEGAKPGEVTAIAVLSGVEPILRARPKGSREVSLGPWTMGGGGGESEAGGGAQGP